MFLMKLCYIFVPVKSDEIYVYKIVFQTNIGDFLFYCEL
jgi:hypothetical protein